MSDLSDEDEWLDYWDHDDPDDADPGCTWCGGDGIGGGCHDPIQCCGEDVCHPCRGTGLRANQTVF